MKKLLSNNSKRLSCVAIAIFSISSAYFVQYAIPVEARLYYSIGAFPLIACFVFYVFLNKYWLKLYKRAKRDKRETIVTVIVATVLSMFTVFGAWIVSSPAEEVIRVSHFVAVLVCAIWFYVLLIGLWAFLDKGKAPDGSKVSPLWCMVVFSIIAICWMPYLLASWPGFSVVDTAVEWGEYTEGTQLNVDLIGHTMFMGSLIELGMSIWGDANAGQAFFTIIQAIIIDATFVAMLGFMKSNGVSKVLLYGSLAYLALSPTIASCAMWSVKDVSYSAALVIVCIFTYAVVEKNQSGWRKIVPIVGLTLATIVLCLMRGNGRFVVAISFLLMLLFVRASAKKALMSILLVIIIGHMGLSSYLASLVDDAGEEKSQGVSIVFLVPIQQLAYVSYNGYLSESESAMLEEMGYHTPSAYYENIADFAAREIHMTNSSFIRAYIKVGIKHPYEYFAAALKMTQDAWNPYSYVDAYNANNASYASKQTSFLAFYTSPPGEADSKNPALLASIKNIGLNLVLQKIPGLAVLVSIPVCLWLSLIAFARSIIVKRKGAAAITILLLVASLTAILGPCILGRYFLFLFFGLPMILFCLTRRVAPINDATMRVSNTSPSLFV